MRKKRKTEKDYMDPMVIDYWDTYVAPGLAEYLASITTKEDFPSGARYMLPEHILSGNLQVNP